MLVEGQRPFNATAPPRLVPGAVVGIAAPAWPCGPQDATRIERAVRMLAKMDLHARMAPNALRHEVGRSLPARDRAADLNSLFRDPEVSAIVALGGGGNVHALLPYLEWDAIRETPKIVMGYSAVTALLIALTVRVGIITFHGPMILNGFSEYPELLGYTREQMDRILWSAEAPLALRPPSEWTSAPPSETRARQMQPHHGWRCIREGHATGPLVGGNLMALRSLSGTSYWPSMDGVLLFIEEVNLGQGLLHTLEESLAHLKLLGALDEIAGLMVGRINDVSEAEAMAIDEMVEEYVEDRAIPIMSRVDFGHTDPRLILPIGARATMDTVEASLILPEPAVAERP